ncbi:hypothetical protein BHE74_00002159 [Ensete ventricosum]|nr:hypothetical protein BHE74_00002159 [Ensete ventricosum]RZS28252.1 hypothetical protein BHM03_00061823 [Ensete ventricosum]
MGFLVSSSCSLLLLSVIGFVDLPSSVTGKPPLLRTVAQFSSHVHSGAASPIKICILSTGSSSDWSRTWLPTTSYSSSSLSDCKKARS